MLIGGWQIRKHPFDTELTCSWPVPYTGKLAPQKIYYAIQMHRASFGLKLCSCCTASKPINFIDMRYCTAQRQLRQPEITSKASTQQGSSNKTGQKRDVIALLRLYTRSSNLCIVWTGLPGIRQILLPLWHSLSEVWIATSQQMQWLLNLRPPVDVNNVYIWASQLNSLFDQRRKITVFAL